MQVFYLFLALVTVSIFALPIFAIIDVLFLKDDNLTDYERSASLIDRK